MIRKTCQIIQVLVLISWVLGFGACSKPQPDEVVASVDDFQIRVGDLENIMEREKVNYGQKSLKDKKYFNNLKKNFLEEIISQQLLLQEAYERGVGISEEEMKKEIRRFKSQYTEMSFQNMLREIGISNEEWIQKKRDKLLVKNLLEQKVNQESGVSPEIVKEVYESNIEKYKVPESVRVRQIVTDTKEKAESILRRLRNGENFAKLARDQSLSPDRMKGGDLGFIYKGSFPREFEVCFTMNPGEISPIIPSLYGFHVFKVLEKSPPKTLELKEVENRIALNIKQRLREESRIKLLEELRDKSKIVIHEELLKRISL